MAEITLDAVEVFRTKADDSVGEFFNAATEMPEDGEYAVKYPKDGKLVLLFMDPQEEGGGNVTLKGGFGVNSGAGDLTIFVESGYGTAIVPDSSRFKGADGKVHFSTPAAGIRVVALSLNDS